jgi:hypothetical protein
VGAGAQPLEHRAVLIAQGEDFPAAPLPLTTTSVVVSTGRYFQGPVGRFALVENLDQAEPSVTPLTGPEVLWGTSDLAGRGHTGIVRLSATRVLSAHWGPDGLVSSGDEGVVLLDGLGGANTAISIPLGTMGDPQVVRIDERTAVVASFHGPTGSFLLSDLGGTNQVTPIGDVFPRLALTPTRVLVDSEAGYAVLRLRGPEPVEIVPLADEVWEPIALGGRKLLVSAVGGLRFFPDVDTPAVSTLIPLPPVCYLVRSAPDRALARLVGPDGVCGPGRDDVAWIEDIGGRNRVTIAPLAVHETRGGWRPVAVGDRAAVVTAQRDGETGIVIARRSGLTRFIPRPWAGDGVRVLSPRRFLTTRAGARPYESREDEVLDVFTLGAKPRFASAVVPYARGTGAFGPPELLGNGRGVFIDSSTFSNYNDGLSDLRSLRVVEGLPDGIRLKKVALEVDGADVRLAAGFSLPAPATFVLADLTLRIGDVSQTIPAAAIRRTGRRFTYSDPEGANGFFRLVEYDARARTLRVEGRSAEPEAPLGTNRVVSLESTEFYIASAASHPVE